MHLKHSFRLIPALLVLTALLLSCSKDEEDQPSLQNPAPGHARLSGTVTSASGPVSGARLHVVYEPEYLTDGAVTLATNGSTGPQTSSACAVLSHSNPSVRIWVGPLGGDSSVALTRRPQVRDVPGCMTGCAPAGGYVWDGELTGPWELTLQGGEYYFCQSMVLPDSGAEGCVLLSLEYILPSSICCDAIFTASDNMVRIQWWTNTEPGYVRYEIERDGELIGRVDALHDPSGHLYTFSDFSALNGTTYIYRLAVVSFDGERVILDSDTVTPHLPPLPTVCQAYPVYPNPVKNAMHLPFEMPAAETVTLKLFDGSGRETVVAADSSMPAGRLTLYCWMNFLPNGIYEYRLSIGSNFRSNGQLLKNERDYDVLGRIRHRDSTAVDGHYQFDIAIGDTIAVMDDNNLHIGAAALRRVTVVAIAPGYQPTDTTLTLSNQSQPTIDFVLTPEP